MKLNISEEKYKALSDEAKTLLKEKFAFHSNTKLWHSKDGVTPEEAFEVSKAIEVYPTVTWSPTKEQYNKLTSKQKEDIRTVMRYDAKTAIWESRQNCGEQATYVLRAIGEKPYLDFEEALKGKLMKGMEQIKTSDDYINYLISMSKFINYSPHNQILIALQNPQASLIASRTKWQKDFERKINPDAVGVVILAPNIKKVPDVSDEEKQLIKEGKLDKKDLPTRDVLVGFRTARVYDVSDTFGKDIPEAPVNQLDGTVDNYEQIKNAIIAVAKPYSVEFVPQSELGSANGTCNFLDKKIKVCDSLAPAQTIKTMFHEVAHANMHERSDEDIESSKIDRQTKELQAESAAFMLCQKYGIDSSDYTFGYIAVWTAGKNPEDIYNALEASAGAAKSISHKIGIALSMEQNRQQKQNQKHDQQAPGQTMQ